MFAFLYCVLGVCSPVPTQEWFAEDVFGCSVRRVDGTSSLFSGELQGSHPEMRGLLPLGVNQSRPQLVSTVLQHSMSWVMLVYSQPLPDIKLLRSMLELPFSKIRFKHKGSCVLFKSCN